MPVPKTKILFQLEKQYVLEQNEELKEAAWAALYPRMSRFSVLPKLKLT
jgi:hypothetical protein